MADYSAQNLARVRALVRAYGPSPARWPADERHLSELVRMADDAGLSGLVAEGQALDHLLDTCEVPALSQRLTNAVLTIPAGSARGKLWLNLWPFQAVWQPASIAVVALVAGIAAGQLTQAPTNTALDVDEEYTVAVGDLALGAASFVTGYEQ